MRPPLEQKTPGFPIKNVGNDREGKTGMTEGDIGKCQRMTEHLQFPTPVPDLIGDLIGDPGFCPHVSSLIRRAEEKDSGSPIRSGMTAGGSPTRGQRWRSYKCLYLPFTPPYKGGEN